LSPLSTSSRAPMLRHALAACWIVALYFICNPYRGVRHDAVLYFGQMQFHLTPSWLQGDVFFLSNSQDHYSIFSAIFAPVLQALGLSSAEILILLALHALFLFATWQLTSSMPATTRWCALALVLVLPHFYSAKHRFAFAEPFLTARSLAEPFAILTLAMILRSRTTLALVAATVAAVSHPLIALPACLIGWRLLCAQDRRWNWAALLALPVLLLAWLQVPPFAALAHRYDAEWFLTVQKADSFVFLGSWRFPDWEQLIFDAGLLALCARDASLPMGRLARTTLVVTLACLVASAIGADLLRDVLLTQMQLWRATWLAHLVAMLSLGPLLVGLWKRGGKGRLAVLTILLAAITVSSTVQTGWVVGMLAFAAVALAESRAVVGTAVLRIGFGVCVVAALLISGVLVISQLDQLTMGRDSGLLIGRASAIPSASSMLVLCVSLLGLWPLVRPGRTAVACSAAGVALLLVAGASQWDQRADWTRYVEQSQGRPHPFQALIPPGQTVYWPGDLMASWALVGRSSFYDVAQMSGSLFSRETSLRGMEQREAVGPLVIQHRMCMSIVESGLSDTTANDCKPTDVAVHDVCHAKRVHPDFIVLHSPLRAPPLATWRHFSPDGSEPADHFLYQCSSFE
jgi:hypothetical protein